MPEQDVNNVVTQTPIGLGPHDADLTIALLETRALLAKAEEALQREIHERKCAEAALSKAMTGARSLYWSGTVLFTEQDREERSGRWNIDYANEEIIKLWLPIKIQPGQTFAQAWGYAVSAFDRRDIDQRAVDALFSGQPGYTQEFRIKMADGEVMWFLEEVQAEPIGYLHWRVNGVCTDITGRKRREAQAELIEENSKLEVLATIDGLTGLPNHRAFQERLRIEFEQAVHYNSPLSFIMVDLDKFKDYNDAYGHPAGDEVLRKVSAILRKNARDIDLTARYGGEEFAIVVPADMEVAISIAERLRSAMEVADWEQGAVTASFGVNTFISKSAHPSAASIIAEADQALYASKSRGRNRVTHALDLVGSKQLTVSSLAINIGGDAVEDSRFAEDQYFHGGTVRSFGAQVDTSAEESPAPPAVYQSERYGDFTYEVSNLVLGGFYLVRLHFVESECELAGERVFNVLINGELQLANFDILAEAGSRHKAIVKEFPVGMRAGGEIDVELRGVVGIAKLNGLEIIPFQPTEYLSINCGGGGVWPFVEDCNFSGGNTETQVSEADTGKMDLSDVDGFVPSEIYRSERYGRFSYTIPGPPPGASCLVSLHFCELFWPRAGDRIFDVHINGLPVLCNFDIIAETNALLKPIVKKVIAVANSSGELVIDFKPVCQKAQVVAIDVHW